MTGSSAEQSIARRREPTELCVL
eukprot:COSAG02_NODE_57036_length_282_cov_0.912568_1_plen_22_part_01